jgi:hypothetical protein
VLFVNVHNKEFTDRWDDRESAATTPNMHVCSTWPTWQHIDVPAFRLSGRVLNCYKCIIEAPAYQGKLHSLRTGMCNEQVRTESHF